MVANFRHEIISYFSRSSEKYLVLSITPSHTQLFTNFDFFYRLGGIYGPGEQAMFPRPIRSIKAKLLNFAHCLKKDLLIDLVHIDNAVQGHIKVRHKSDV